MSDIFFVSPNSSASISRNSNFVGPRVDCGVRPSPPAEIKRFLDMLLTSGKSGITIVQMRQIIAVRARDLRWASEINLKGADAVHVATAIEMKCDELWTRDGRIWKKRAEIGQL
jgi:hypothetical protein